MSTTEFDAMKNKVMVEVTGKVGHDVMRFISEDKTQFNFEHYQDCCERVQINDIVGDLKDLIGSPILTAEETTDSINNKPEDAECFTWTFYTFTTAKGTVTVKWLGESNGCYSERVSFSVIAPPKDPPILFDI